MRETIIAELKTKNFQAVSLYWNEKCPKRRTHEFTRDRKSMSVIVGKDTFAFSKPDPRHITATIARAGGDPRRAVMVGDSRADVAAAQELGCTTFVEFGPGKVLSGLVKKIDAALVTANVGDLASLDATVALLD